MECSVVFLFCLLAVFATTTRARSLTAKLDTSHPKESNAFKAFEAKFIEMLGMKEKPRPKRDVVAPQYMLDLYNSRVEDEDYISTNLVFKDFATTANTVRAFHHTDVPEQSGRVNMRSKRHVHLDIASLPSHEELVKAEFRVYNSRSNSSSAHGLHIMSIYQITAPGVRRLLDSRVVNVSSMGWQSYDILQAVQHWHKTPGENHGLEVEIMNENGHPIDISHLHFDKPHELDEQQWTHQRPLLALFSRDPNTHYHKKRVRRSSSHRSNYKGLCKRFNMKVDFRKLNWTWVLQPGKYDAYMCQGKCIYPLPNHLNATNHAIVQTLVSSVPKYKQKVPPACCVPTELESTILLFQNSNGVVQLKDYPDMKVSQCGCR